MPTRPHTNQVRSDKLMQRILLEEALREQARRRKKEYQTFHDFLGEVTPAWNWNYPHLLYIQHYLQKIADGELKKLMIFIGRQYGKSEQGTIRFPAYVLERDPTKRIAVVSYGAELAESFSGKTRTIVRQRGQVPLSLERSAKSNWQTKAGGFVKACGVDGPLIGFGFNLVVMDDAIKGQKEADSPATRETTWKWYANDLKGCAQLDTQFVYTCTRWNDDDLAARILAHEDDWTVIRLPVICEGDDPPDYEEITGKKREIGELLCPELHDWKQVQEFKNIMKQDFYAIMQGKPTPAEGEVFKKKWFCKEGKIENPVEEVSRYPNHIKLTQVWDTALEKGQRNDNSAMVEGCKGKDGLYYVCALVNKQLHFPELIREMKSHRNRATREGIEPDVCTEDTAQGKPTRQQLRTEGIPVIEIPAGTSDKEVRAKSITQYCESNMIRFVALEGNLNAELLSQLLKFPHGKNDDLVDAFVHLLRRLTGGAQKWSTSKIKEIMGSIAK